MNYGFEIVCASVFTVFCIISARIYSISVSFCLFLIFNALAASYAVTFQIENDLKQLWGQKFPEKNRILNRAYTYWDKKKINGPLPRYIYGTWSGFSEKFLGHEDYNNVLKYGKIYGTYDGITPNLIVTDPELIKEIVTAPTDKLQDIKFVTESSVVLRDSLMTLCGGEKPEVQILMSTLLEPRKLEKLMFRLESSAEVLIANISNKKRQEDGLVNLTSFVTEFVDEVIALTVFGIDLNADIHFRDDFVRNTQQILKVKSPQSIRSLLPFLYENYFKEPWICSEKALQYFVNLIISGMSESSSEAVLTEGKPSSLIELMVEAAKEEKKLLKKEKEDENPDPLLSDNVIISKCIASMLVLANLTRTVLILGIYALANDEEAQEKLYKEVEKTKSEVTSYENIKSCNYLDKILKEVLRLYPFEFRLERITIRGIKLGDIDLDKNVRVSIPLYALHRLEEYHPEPEKFDPERFSQSASEERNLHSYLAFGQAGLNGSDISFQLGILATKVTLFKLIEKFKFSTAQELSWYRLFQKGFTRVPKPEKIEIFVETRM